MTERQLHRLGHRGKRCLDPRVDRFRIVDRRGHAVNEPDVPRLQPVLAFHFDAIADIPQHKNTALNRPCGVVKGAELKIEGSLLALSSHRLGGVDAATVDCTIEEFHEIRMMGERFRKRPHGFCALSELEDLTGRFIEVDEPTIHVDDEHAVTHRLDHATVLNSIGGKETHAGQPIDERDTDGRYGEEQERVQNGSGHAGKDSHGDQPGKHDRRYA